MGPTSGLRAKGVDGRCYDNLAGGTPDGLARKASGRSRNLTQRSSVRRGWFSTMMVSK